MAVGLHGAICWFQKKIGTYDKTNWEITVEKQEVSQVLTDKLSVAKLPSDLLDLDLIRGSTFTKAKPGYHWTLVTSKGFLKVLLFPFYYRWWLQQTSCGVWLFFVSLYFLQLVALVIYFFRPPGDEFLNKSWPEAVVPLMVMFILGEMYIHVVSTNFTKPIAHKIKKKKQRSERGGRAKRKLLSEESNSRDEETGNSNNDNNNNETSNSNNDMNMERQKREDSAERTDRDVSVERVIISTDEDRLIHDSETEVDKTLGVRNRFNGVHNTNVHEQSNDDNNDENVNRNDTTADKSDETCRHKRTTRVQHSNASAEETSAGEDHSDSSTSSISNDEADEMQEITDTETADLLFPKCDGTSDINDLSETNMLRHIRRSNDLITVSMWDGNSFKKVKFTFFEIGLTVVNKVEGATHRSSDYIGIAIISAIIIGFLPIIFRMYQQHVIFKGKPLSQLISQIQTMDGMNSMIEVMLGPTWKHKTLSGIGMLSRITLSFSMFFLLCVAESAYKIRYLYAKYFGALTSTRRARRNRLPHFRLHKVKNIKAWLSLRSFLKKRGPQRSVDTIVSMAAMIDVLLLVIASIQFLCINGKDDGDHFLSYFVSWELSAWSILLGVFLIRFIALGSDINRKYRNQSILLIEQINLYVQMENNTKKKDELLIANNVLKLASKLLKELEGPFKVHGFIMNPLLSNITRVVVLSLFSGVMSDILGFRLRLWKIKA